jgi:hypothetical protein
MSWIGTSSAKQRLFWLLASIGIAGLITLLQVRVALGLALERVPLFDVALLSTVAWHSTTHLRFLPIFNGIPFFHGNHVSMVLVLASALSE